MNGCTCPGSPSLTWAGSSWLVQATLAVCPMPYKYHQRDSSKHLLRTLFVVRRAVVSYKAAWRTVRGKISFKISTNEGLSITVLNTSYPLEIRVVLAMQSGTCYNCVVAANMYWLLQESVVPLDGPLIDQEVLLYSKHGASEPNSQQNDGNGSQDEAHAPESVVERFLQGAGSKSFAVRSHSCSIRVQDARNSV